MAKSVGSYDGEACLNEGRIFIIWIQVLQACFMDVGRLPDYESIGFSLDANPVSADVEMAPCIGWMVSSDCPGHCILVRLVFEMHGA